MSDTSVLDDVDYTTNARPDDILRLLRPLCTATWEMGRAFGTIGGQLASTNRKVEITTFRSEAYSDESRKPEVIFGDDLMVDLLRRDFTINAMAFDVIEPQLITPDGALSDLNARTLRTPTDPRVLFTDDPLRMLRAARFMSRFDFDVDPDAEAAARDLAERLTIVSAERIRVELDLLMMTEKPSRGLDFIVRTGLAEYFLPELPGLALEQDPIHHHKDVLTHTYAVIEKVRRFTEPTESDPEGRSNLVVRLAALFHDVGKPKTRAFTDKGVTFHGHDHVGARMTKKRMSALKYSQQMIDDVAKLVELHLRFHTYAMGWSDAAVRRYVRDADHLLEELNELTRCDCTTRNRRKAQELDRRMNELEARIAELREREDLDSQRPALSGDQVMSILGIPPSRAVGEALNFLLAIRHEEGEISQEEATSRLLAWWSERA
jgi:poly(A) polymerase